MFDLLSKKWKIVSIVIYSMLAIEFVVIAMVKIKPEVPCPEVVIAKPIEIPKPVFVPPDQREEVKRLKAQLRKINSAPPLSVTIVAPGH